MGTCCIGGRAIAIAAPAPAAAAASASASACAARGGAGFAAAGEHRTSGARLALASVLGDKGAPLTRHVRGVAPLPRRTALPPAGEPTAACCRTTCCCRAACAWAACSCAGGCRASPAACRVCSLQPPAGSAAAATLGAAPV
eukprot:scaffold63171_cov33-Phaeocystis_antarctica.AAC.1